MAHVCKRSSCIQFFDFVARSHHQVQPSYRRTLYTLLDADKDWCCRKAPSILCAYDASVRHETLASRACMVTKRVLVLGINTLNPIGQINLQPSVACHGL